MAVESAMLPLGTNAPDFSLRDVVNGQIYRLDSFNEKAAFLVMFICRHCPYVVHVEQEIARIGRDYADAGLGLIAISSNDTKSYPDDAPPRLKEMAERLAFSFPFCCDDTQEVAKAYRAVCTPDFSCSTGSVDWCIEANWTTHVPATTGRSPAEISAPRSMPS